MSQHLSSRIDLPPVFICDKCGRGFLTAQPYNIDQYPLWKVVSSPDEGEVCGGRISIRTRNISASEP